MQNIKTPQQDDSSHSRKPEAGKSRTVKRSPVYAAHQPSKNEFK
ncbi:hypothetical protein OKS80_18815 [Aeromonas veronii]|nr:hypothetical protein [Aeromonas veronii]MCX9114949.1 hypothetical protein [Aeromonas veronii]